MLALMGGALSAFPSNAAALTAAPPEDPRLHTHPELQNCLQHLQAARWDELSRIVEAQTPDGACVLLEDLAYMSAVDLSVSGLDTLPRGMTIAGALFVFWAWRYRGTGPGDELTPAMSRAFSERLSLARPLLERAIRANSDDGVAYNFLFRTLKGLSAVDDMTATWNQFVQTSHRPIKAYATFADALTPRWFGSEELLVGFARTHRAAVEPASHGLIALVANEHIFRRWRRSDQEAMAFAADAGVLSEVTAANDAFLSGGNDADVYRARFAHSHFAFYFAFVGMHDLSRPHLSALGDYVAAPWTWPNDPFDLLRRARTAAGLGET